MPLQLSLTIGTVRASLGALATIASLAIGREVTRSAPVVTSPIGPPSSPSGATAGVMMNYAGAGTNITPSECLTIAVGEGAAYSCGDLRLVQDLPTTTTMSKPRTPRLIYNSRWNGGPWLVPLDYVSLRYQPQTTIMLSLYAGGGIMMTSAFWPAPGIADTGIMAMFTPRRFVVPLGSAWLTTGAYRFSAIYFAGGNENGTIAVINRMSSPFGAGWWLDGLEQLVPYDATHELWVGGDGATRLYTQTAGNVWTVTPAVDRPDTLLHFADGTRTRLLPGGAYVRFDQLGRHVETVSATGEHTSLLYEDPRSPLLLTSIVLPVPSGTVAPRYTFSYTQVGYDYKLSAVDAPPVDAQSRRVQFNTTSAARTVIDADGSNVTFALSSDGHVTGRTDRRGYSTTFQFETAANTLSSATVNLTAGPSITHNFCAAEATGLAPCQPFALDTAKVVTTVTGPRTDVNDYMTFRVTRFGAPARIVDALGRITTIVRGNSRWPMAVTRVIRRNGFTSDAFFSNDRGLVDSTVDLNPYGLGTGRAVTRYGWDAKWSKLVSLTSPVGIVDSTAYDPNTGWPIWQQHGPNMMRRVNYTYDGSGLLVGVEEPSPQSDGLRVSSSLSYDQYGNLSRRTSPRGLSTTITRDEIGRVRSTSQPITDVGVYPERRRVQSFTYDLADRVVSSTDSAQHSVDDPGPEAIHVQTVYDANGNATRVSRWATPDAANIGEVVIASAFDGANRKISEVDPYVGAASRTWTYDAAGNVIAAQRGSAAVSATYDAVNRVVTRTLTEVAQARGGAFSDVQRFGYDAADNITAATNYAAQVYRSFYPNGAMGSEQLRIARADLSSVDHSYVTSYTYDLAGRRQTLTPPTTAGLLASVSYGYDQETGALTRVQESATSPFVYAYNQAGMLSALTKADGSVEQRTYDADGRQLVRSETSPVVGALHYDMFAYDGRGNATAIDATSFGIHKTDAFTYDGLGVVIASGASDGNFSLDGDAFGNAVRARRNGPMETVYRYVPHTMQSTFATTPLLDGWQADTLTQQYDITGDLVSSFEVASGPVVCQPGGSGPIGTETVCPGGGTLRVNATKSLRNTYNGDGRLVQSRKTSSNDNSALWYPPNYVGLRAKQVYPEFERGVLEEFRYDALGRRVWTRADRKDFCPGAHDRDSTPVCVGTIERTVYDGDQALLEIRQPGDADIAPEILESDDDLGVYRASLFGVVGYVNGARLDQPLLIARTREPKAVAHYNWQGRLEFVTNASDGRSVQCGVPTAPPSGECAQISWPATTMTFGMVATDRQRGPGWWWWGTTVSLRQNASGGLDMRNRVYDPQTGRFTQEDPIGLEGGLNLYGFATGDPVNFDDPFGLCPAVLLFAGPVVGGATAVWCGAEVVALGATAAFVWFNKSKTSGESPATAGGREAHKTWEPGAGFQKEVRLPSGRRCDALNPETCEIKELKPDNERAKKRGEKQLQDYKKELDEQMGKDHKTTLETYKPRQP